MSSLLHKGFRDDKLSLTESFTISEQIEFHQNTVHTPHTGWYITCKPSTCLKSKVVFYLNTYIVCTPYIINDLDIISYVVHVGGCCLNARSYKESKDKLICEQPGSGANKSSDICHCNIHSLLNNYSK